MPGTVTSYSQVRLRADLWLVAEGSGVRLRTKDTSSSYHIDYAYHGYHID